jgi:hypothetical protein
LPSADLKNLRFTVFSMLIRNIECFGVWPKHNYS